MNNSKFRSLPRSKNPFYKWHPGLPDEHWGSRLWLRSDNLDTIAYPCMIIGIMYYMMLTLPNGNPIYIRRSELEKWAGPNLRWCRCIAPEE